jgi:hypothetical protein
VIKKTFWWVLLLLISREGRTQGLTYSIDSLALKVSRTVQLEDGSTDTVSCSRFYHFIWFNEIHETAKKINKILYTDLSEQDIQSVAELQQIFKNDFNDWKEEWMAQFSAEDTAPIDFSFGLNWYEEIFIGVSQQTQSTLCTFQSVNGYYGGAHPIGNNQYHVFSLPEAVRIKQWSSLFNNADTMAILIMAEEIFRKEKGLKPSVKLNEAGYWFNDNRFHLTDNFGLDDHGLFFLFNPYEVGPYAEGPIYISIPYHRIRKYLKNPL